MKSKAQQYADALKIKPIQPTFSVVPGMPDDVWVTSLGECTIAIRGTITQEQTLALRDWLTDTFDVPKGGQVTDEN